MDKPSQLSVSPQRVFKFQWLGRRSDPIGISLGLIYQLSPFAKLPVSPKEIEVVQLVLHWRGGCSEVTSSEVSEQQE